MKKSRHILVIEVETDKHTGSRQAQNKLHKWLEHNGHSASTHGFRFVSVGVQTGKRLSHAPRKGDIG